MKNIMKFIVVGLFVCTAGCASFDLDGNGRLDPLAYLASADISVVLTDESGAEYAIAIDDIGKKIVGQLIQAKTGYLFEITDEGGITVTDQNGAKIQIRRKV